MDAFKCLPQSRPRASEVRRGAITVALVSFPLSVRRGPSKRACFWWLALFCLVPFKCILFDFSVKATSNSMQLHTGSLLPTAASGQFRKRRGLTTPCLSVFQTSSNNQRLKVAFSTCKANSPPTHCYPLKGKKNKMEGRCSWRL